MRAAIACLLFVAVASPAAAQTPGAPDLFVSVSRTNGAADPGLPTAATISYGNRSQAEASVSDYGNYFTEQPVAYGIDEWQIRYATSELSPPLQVQ